VGPNMSKQPDASSLQQGRHGLRRLLNGAGAWFPRNSEREAVTTEIRLDASAEAVWKALRFYEEIPNRPGPFLSALLPLPVRSEGDKTTVGASIRCIYQGGHLVKRITVSQPPHLLRFDVVEQNLGIENSVSMGEGSYEIRPCAGGGSEVLLTTHYIGHLRPRFFFRPVERMLAHHVHRHILEGMRTLLRTEAALSVSEPHSLVRLAPAADGPPSPAA
jgi:hypothetical protein